jgi:hypothetical protein
MTEAFPWDDPSKYLIRDRDQIYGAVVTCRLRAMGIRDKPTAPASPWQNGFAERLIGSIRRKCLDHIIVLGEAHLRRILKSYADYERRCAGLSSNSASRKHQLTRPPWRTSSPLRPGLSFRYTQVWYRHTGDLVRNLGTNDRSRVHHLGGTIAGVTRPAEKGNCLNA